MVFHIRPLDFDLNFEKRDYSLGDTLDLTVDLRSRADTGVRGGRVDLVCEEKYVQTSSSFMPDTYSPQTAGGLVISGRTGHIADERKERFVHSSVALLDATTLPAARRIGAPLGCASGPRTLRTWPRPGRFSATPIARGASSGPSSRSSTWYGAATRRRSAS